MSGGLRVVFAGTPAFAAQALERLLGSRHQVVAVMTQPDRPAGRGQHPGASPVKARALAAGLPVLQPESLRLRAEPSNGSDEAPGRRRLREERNQGAADALATLGALAPDVIVVAAYGLILPPPVLDLPRLGCLNIHASLLPRWRGAAPIVRAIEAGDAESGICIMRMEEGLDTGPVGLVRRTAIAPDETAGRLHDRLAAIGADAIIDVLDLLGGVGTHSEIVFEPQAEHGVSYARKVDKAEARIRWDRDAAAVARQIRAFDPHPGAQSALARRPETAIRCFDATPVPTPVTDVDPEAGTIVSAGKDGLVVACGSGCVAIRSLQRAGGRRMSVAEFRRGFDLQPGDALVGATD